NLQRWLLALIHALPKINRMISMLPFVLVFASISTLCAHLNWCPRRLHWWRGLLEATPPSTFCRTLYFCASEASNRCSRCAFLLHLLAEEYSIQFYPNGPKSVCA